MTMATRLVGASSSEFDLDRPNLEEYLAADSIKEASPEKLRLVRDMNSARAGLKKVPWDRYLKYVRPSPKLTEKKQQIFAEPVMQRLNDI